MAPTGDGAPPPVRREVRAVSQHAAAALLTLDRPETSNALGAEMLRALVGELRALDDDTEICAVLVTGAGRCFSAGGDLKAYLELQRDPDRFPRWMDEWFESLAVIPRMSKPVVALVNGVTAAGGLELLLACDFAIAAQSARVGDAHLNYGQMGGGGVLTLLPRMIGVARARELVFTGRLLEAEEALAWGLVNRVVADDALVEEGFRFATSVAAKGAPSVAAAKAVLNGGWSEGLGVEAAFHLEKERAIRYCLTEPDAVEGARAFADKRAPEFRRGAVPGADRSVPTQKGS